jgi:hypothetical protein
MNYANIVFEIGVPITTAFGEIDYATTAALYAGAAMTDINIQVSSCAILKVQRGVLPAMLAGLVMMEVTVAGPQADMLRLQAYINKRVAALR